MADMKVLQSTSMLDGGNIVYLEQQYEDFLRDPNSVSEKWRSYFEQLPIINGQARDIPHSEIRRHFHGITRNSGLRRQSSAPDVSIEHERKQIEVTKLIDLSLIHI